MDMKKHQDVVKMNYPSFITDKPEGKDLYEGQSQNRIAENISQFITENEASNRKVIGIEGEWGSGKSNVIEILRNKLSDTYYFFVFDSWGHQEDLTRRSILEGLLIKLIKDDILKGKKELWEQKLKKLLSKKIETEHKDIPKISWAILLSVLGILLTPITKFIAETYLKSLTTPTSTPNFIDYIISGLILFSSFIFLLIWIIISISNAEKGNKKKVFEELFYVYKGKEITNTSEETISENEPTVQQFITFLSDLENGSKKKLVIVFDNMDRLPVTKVKEIWSSIHTFFASDDNNLKTWAIVTFDDVHICDIFKDENTIDKQRADSYIHKTFSIVFHVSPPILSDWKNFFYSKFNNAFGYPAPPDQFIETIFDYCHLLDPKIKPRDIICFVNDLVALKKLWNDQIPFKYLALFALKRKEIMMEPFKQIISKEYIGTVASLFEYDEELDTNISALAFNAPVNIADEILLKPTIEKALIGEGDLIQICTRKSFFEIFDSAFYKYSKPDIFYTISCLDKLLEEIQKKSEMQKYWNKLSDTVLKVEKFEIKYVDPIKTLARRLTNHSASERILKYLFSHAISLNEQKQKYFSGAKYRELIASVDSILKDVWKEKSVTELLFDNGVEPDEYFEFIYSCPESYQQYKVTCTANKINAFLITKFDSNEISSHIKHLDIIKIDTDLSEFKKHIEDIIVTLAPTLPNWQLILTNIYAVGKSLSLNGKLAFVVPENIAIALLTANPTHERAVDLLLSIISANISNPMSEHTKNEAFKKILGEVGHKELFIQSYKYYLNYSELIKYDLQFPSVLIKNVITELTSRDNSISGSDAPFLLSKYNEIKASILGDKPDLLNLFISKVNSFYNKADVRIVTADSLSFIIPIIKDNHSLDCNVINDIILQANDFIEKLDKDTWISSLKKYDTSKIIELFRTLIQINKYNNSRLPQNANNAYPDVVISISKKELPTIPSDIDFWNMLFSMLTGNFTTLFKNVRDELLNYNHAAINIDEMLFFEKGLFKFGKLSEDQKTADDTLRRILIPLANNDERYTNLLKMNASNIKKIVEKANESIIDFKESLDSKCPSIFTMPEMKQFSEILIKKYKLLKEKFNAEEIKKEEVK